MVSLAKRIPIGPIEGIQKGPLGEVLAGAEEGIPEGLLLTSRGTRLSAINAGPPAKFRLSLPEVNPSTAGIVLGQWKVPNRRGQDSLENANIPDQGVPTILRKANILNQQSPIN